MTLGPLKKLYRHGTKGIDNLEKSLSKEKSGIFLCQQDKQQT